MKVSIKANRYAASTAFLIEVDDEELRRMKQGDVARELCKLFAEVESEDTTINATQAQVTINLPVANSEPSVLSSNREHWRIRELREFINESDVSDDALLYVMNPDGKTGMPVMTLSIVGVDKAVLIYGKKQ